jgi:hypothetical protein
VVVGFIGFAMLVDLDVIFVMVLGVVILAVVAVVVVTSLVVVGAVVFAVIVVVNLAVVAGVEIRVVAIVVGATVHKISSLLLKNMKRKLRCMVNCNHFLTWRTDNLHCWISN